MARIAQDALTIKRLRQGIGIVGMALPFVVTIGISVHAGRLVLPSSISGAYHTNMRDVFVGSMCAVGVFLIFYRHSRASDILGTIAGVAAIAAALFPSTPDAPDLVVAAAAANDPARVAHAVSAAVLFLSMAGFCFFLFPAGSPKGRRITYYLCGALIVAGLVLALMGSRILPGDIAAAMPPLLWGETIAVLAFGVAWFTRSNTLFPDAQIRD